MHKKKRNERNTMAILNTQLEDIIRRLKKNGYKVDRDGGHVTEEGFATGILTIRYKDKQGFGIKVDVDLLSNTDHDTELKKMFSL